LDLIDLKTNIRTVKGNGAARTMRREGRIPAVLYGRRTDPMLLSVSTHDLETVLKKSAGGQALLNLMIQNGETTKKTAMIKELQTHPVSRNFLHVDFYEIDMKRKIRVKVPVIAVGKSKGVEDGGTLQLVRRDLEVLCLPLEIPEAFEVDISELGIGDSVHVNEIRLDDNIEIPEAEEVNFTVLTVVSPKAEEEVEAEVEEEVAEGEEGEEAAAAEGEAPEDKPEE